MAKAKLTDSELVTQHIQTLSPSIQPAVEYLRRFILSIDKEIGEHVKWNSPAFYYAGDMKVFDAKEYKRDLLVMNLRKNKIMCVLPTGATIKVNKDLLEGDYTDGRRMIHFKNLEDIRAKEKKLKATITEWLTLVEK
ncbi:DUF1801 domain-containing protein [Gynurincola endophyticus]|uniref:DUF1801 domain-containing protein n=1 Tax=Gynurincola endophyticus TaxID=2479004 RepID=UPI000F8E7E20|nr:DUF1801 domain-containing protein [Gynurincola endophyticus]